MNKFIWQQPSKVIEYGYSFGNNNLKTSFCIKCKVLQCFTAQPIPGAPNGCLTPDHLSPSILFSHISSYFHRPTPTAPAHEPTYYDPALPAGGRCNSTQGKFGFSSVISHEKYLYKLPQNTNFPLRKNLIPHFLCYTTIAPTPASSLHHLTRAVPLQAATQY